MITARGATLLVVAALLWALGRLLGVEELFVVAVATAALVLAALAAVRLSATTVSVRRDLTNSRLRPGDVADVRIDLRNESRWDRAPVLLVSDDCHWTLAERPRFLVSGVRPSGTVRLSYRVRGSARGRYAVGPLRVSVRDPFGVVQLVRHYTATDEVVVYPVVEPLPQGLAQGNHRGSGTSDDRRLFNTGDEFHTMREYQQGDDLRLIHWPSTAHRSKLMVRQQELPWQAEASVFCDTRLAAHHGSGPASTLEKAVSAAASVVWHLADHGYRLRLLTADAGGATRVTTADEILDELAELAGVTEPRLVGLSALRGAGAEGLLVAITAVPDGEGPLGSHPDVRALLQAGRGFASRIGVIVHGAGSDRPRAEATAALLRVTGWRTTTVTPGETLTARWPEVVGARRHGPAYAPDPT